MFFVGTSILCVAFWMGMIVDCVAHETSPRAKLAWLLVIIFGWAIGAPLYLFMRKLPRQCSAWLNCFRRINNLTASADKLQEVVPRVGDGAL